MRFDRFVGSAVTASLGPTWRFESASRTLSPSPLSPCALAVMATFSWTRSAAASTPLSWNSHPSRSCPAIARHSIRMPSPSAKHRRPTRETRPSEPTNTSSTFFKYRASHLPHGCLKMFDSMQLIVPHSRRRSTIMRREKRFPRAPLQEFSRRC